MQSSTDLLARHHDLTERIIAVFYSVANELGYGFLESVYRRAMAIALTEAGIKVEEEVPVPVLFRGEVIGNFRADLLVQGLVILELKTSEEISKLHEAQLLHYLRSSRVEIGYVMSFGQKALFRRLVVQNERKKTLRGDHPR